MMIGVFDSNQRKIVKFKSCTTHFVTPLPVNHLLSLTLRLGRFHDFLSALDANMSILLHLDVKWHQL